MTVRLPVDAPSPAGDPDPEVTELMSTNLVGITGDSPVSTALRLMASTGVRHLPVMIGPRCLGMVVEADLVDVLARTGPLDPGLSRLVGEIARGVRDLPATARRSDAARCMRSDTSDAVLVVEHERVVGIVTATDLIRSLAPDTRAAELTELTELTEEQT